MKLLTASGRDDNGPWYVVNTIIRPHVTDEVRARFTEMVRKDHPRGECKVDVVDVTVMGME